MAIQPNVIEANNAGGFMARIQRAGRAAGKRFATKATRGATNWPHAATGSGAGLEPALQILEIGRARLELFTTAQHDHRIVLSVGHELAHALPVHEPRAMDADE